MSQERCRTNSFFVSQYVKQNEEAISYRHYSIDCENCVTIFTSLLFMILACAVHAAQFTLLNAHCRHSPPPHLHSLLKKHGNVVSPSSLWPRVPSWSSSIHLMPEVHNICWVDRRRLAVRTSLVTASFRIHLSDVKDIFWFRSFRFQSHKLRK